MLDIFKDSPPVLLGELDNLLAELARTIGKREKRLGLWLAVGGGGGGGRWMGEVGAGVSDLKVIVVVGLLNDFVLSIALITLCSKRVMLLAPANVAFVPREQVMTLKKHVTCLIDLANRSVPVF